MIFSVLGGDDRSVYLAKLLRRDCHTVRAFALEKAIPDCAESPEAALSGTDCVILPLPCGQGGVLNAPYSAAEHRFETLLSSADAGTVVCAGRVTAELREVCDANALALHDYFLDECFTLKNAELTAEGALALLLSAPWALRGSRVLICGFGRIGQMLAGMLLPLGCRVTVAARRREARALARALGYAALPLEPEMLTGERWDAVVNTVPAALLGAEVLEGFGRAQLIELASPPYGFDFDAAKALGREIILAAGLPGKSAPRAAAEAVRDTVYGILEESTWKSCGSGWR